MSFVRLLLSSACQAKCKRSLQKSLRAFSVKADQRAALKEGERVLSEAHAAVHTSWPITDSVVGHALGNE